MEKGAPSQKTCRSPRIPNPSRKEDSCFAVLSSSSRRRGRPLLAPLAAAVVVHVRVEGKTQTIFGGTEPRAFGANALDVLLGAARAAEFYAHVTQSSFGPYVDQIGYYPGAGQTGWVFKVNGSRRRSAPTRCS